LQGTVYTTINLSLQFNFLPPFQLFALFYWPVSFECSQNKNPNSAVVPSPLQLHKSGAKYDTSCH